eukprot:CAMPEP_0201727974 /NCGR_PEP_ID=MMETSP0593-20130828/14323_1 /ASSEMBLY_ACC=CAM_ASM_000672 /TAXON_ID=267983 /ORGANISM="Skeletonema japonicum, Strain CCMP2506" /LENGTH=299 /DNA_ID=CAMNT_0048219939 /DNA_START=11 /DNA_END=907 /DNA_ORIENTATION=-
MEKISNKISETFIPVDEEGAERLEVAGQPVVIYRPKRKVVGMTFLVTAAAMPISKYTSIINALTSADHVVVGIYVNAITLNRQAHRQKAEAIPRIFEELKSEFRVKKYDIVGHSVGGKIALVTAALFDSEQNLIRNIIALDPVDQHPVEFTNDLLKQAMAGGSNDNNSKKSNLSLASSKADITVTFTDCGGIVGKKHHAREIQKKNPTVELVLHRNAGHMVYCDDGGVLSWKALMARGQSADRNDAVKAETLHLIKEKAMKATISGSASGKASGVVAKAKKEWKSAKAELKELGDDAQK